MIWLPPPAPPVVVVLEAPAGKSVREVAAQIAAARPQEPRSGAGSLPRHLHPSKAPVAQQRPSEPASRARPAGLASWLASPTARRVVRRESGGDCTAVNPSGKYRGKWQMDASFWKSYGGLAYASRPDLASCHEQDLVAYAGWKKRGWAPWTTA